MPEQHLYEYAVIRYVPNVEREEFINVGVILFSKRANYIKIRYHINKDKIRGFESETDLETLQEHLEAFEKICTGAQNGGPIASLDVPERFRWLTAVRSASLQTSRPHPGFAADLDATLEKLFQELVL
ncbi:MAG: DUF3037 domain-containing protein [Saprospiraceae bacterium]|nr:DUF3037 domain-containing protein [Saprospiraceae bacterium]